MLKILTNNRLFFIIFFIWVVFGAVLQLLFSPTEIMFWINRHHNSLTDSFFCYITLLGEDTIWLGLLLYFTFEKYTKGIKNNQAIKVLLISWLSKVLVSVSLKNVFNYPRPIEVYQHSSRAIHLVDGITIHHWLSFPWGIQWRLLLFHVCAYLCWIDLVWQSFLYCWQCLWGILACISFNIFRDMFLRGGCWEWE